MSFDSDYCSGASPGANPLWGQKRHKTVDIWHVNRVSFHSSLSPWVIHPRHRHRHCRQDHHRHHHHHHFSRVLSSCLLPPAFFQATLSSSVFIHVRVPYRFLKQN